MSHAFAHDSHVHSDEAHRLLETLLQAGAPLADHLHEDVCEGLPTGLYDALILDRGTRDRLAILEPRSARWFRRLLLGSDLRPWYQEYRGAYLIAVPQGWTSATFGVLPEAEAWQCFRGRFPALGDHLAPLADRLRRHDGHGYWWELREVEQSPALRRPGVCWPELAAAPCFSQVGMDVLVCGGAWLSQPDPFVLGVLASRPAWFVLTQICAVQHDAHGVASYRLATEQIARIPLPHASEAAAHAIGALAAQLTATAQERHELRRLTRQRLLKEFGPPGSVLSEPLLQWWTLDFAVLRAEMTRVFGGDIPERYRPEVQRWFEQQCAAHRTADESIRTMEAQLDGQAAGVFRLDAAEQAVLERLTRS